MRLSRRTVCSACAALLSIPSANAITLDLSSADSVRAAAKTVARGMMNYYTGDQYGQIPGLLPQPYYWWEAGAMFGSLIDYWYYTGDDTWNQITMDALQFQTAPTLDYMPQNQSKTLGNDDQAFWGIAAMQAAETNFPNPEAGRPSWLALVQAVFNLQAFRWDNTTCNGGLRWQIYWFNNGYHYKNSISQGCFFDIAARLGAYTRNETYFEHADRMWDWSSRIGLIGTDYAVYDGSDDNLNCTELNHIEWTYNNGIFLHGAAVMWNQTTGDRQAVWRTRIEGLITHSALFFDDNNIMYEQACESVNNCNIDQRSFKAYLSRWQAATTKLAPWTADLLLPRLQISAKAAAQSCSGGSDGVTCGTKWNVNGWDGKFGVGEQMSALEVIQSQLLPYVNGPKGNKTGATSIGNPSAGTSHGDIDPTIPTRITTADKAGAGILTAIMIIGTLSGGWFICSS